MAAISVNSVVDYTKWSGVEELKGEKFEIFEKRCEKYQLMCVVCIGPLENPVVLKCQHLFCENCFNGLTSKICPTCRAPFESSEKARRENNIISGFVEEILEGSFQNHSSSSDPEETVSEAKTSSFRAREYNPFPESSKEEESEEKRAPFTAESLRSEPSRGLDDLLSFLPSPTIPTPPYDPSNPHDVGYFDTIGRSSTQKNETWRQFNSFGSPRTSSVRHSTASERAGSAHPRSSDELLATLFVIQECFAQNDFIRAKPLYLGLPPILKAFYRRKLSIVTHGIKSNITNARRKEAIEMIISELVR